MDQHTKSPDERETDPRQQTMTHAGWPHRLAWRVWRIARLILMCMVVAIALLVFTPLGDWFGSDLVQIDPLERADYIVVLDGDNGRAVEAARLYRDGWAPKVIVSTVSPEYAGQLANLVTAYGVPPADIILDGQSQRTADHPAGIAGLPGIDTKQDSFILITSAYHTARAKACFVRAGYQHIRLRTPDWDLHGQFGPARPRSWRERASLLPHKFHEIVGLWYYRLRGWA